VLFRSLALLAGELQDDGNDQHRLFDAALRLQPKHPWARLRVAQHELSREHPELALRLANELLTDFPLFAPAHIVKVRALDRLGERIASFRAAEDAFNKLPFVPSVAREAVSASRRADRLVEAAERAHMVVALRFDDTDTRRGLAAMLADLGRISDAVDQYRKVLALDPFDSGTLLRLADLLAANGQLPESRALFEKARTLAPDEPEVWERTGRALLHAREKDAALAAFQRALVLRPQNPALKEALRSLRGESDAASTSEAFALSSLLDEAKKLEAKNEDADRKSVV
jgi:tetratricopeptide (TPR) repeat protein